MKGPYSKSNSGIHTTKISEALLNEERQGDK